MNVLITNKQEELLSDLNVEIIKTLRGEFDVEEIIGTFSNFFFGRMILDMTALKDYSNIITFQKLSIGLAVDKIILLVPENTEFASPTFLSRLISLGFYNFTTNLDGIRYLLEHPNSYKDVAHIHQIDIQTTTQNNSNNNGNNNVQPINQNPYVKQPKIIGFKNVTHDAGSTTLIYLLYRELVELYHIDTLVIEINKNELNYYINNNNTDISNSLLSVNEMDIQNVLSKNSNVDVILVDLNDNIGEFCNEVIYLVEPSIFKVNQLLSQDSSAFTRLAGRKVILNKALLSNEEIGKLINETGLNVWAAVHPLNDRSRPPMLTGLLKKLGLINSNANPSVNSTRGLFGNYRR